MNVDGTTGDGTTTIDGSPGTVTIDLYGTVDGNSVIGITTGDLNVSGIGNVDGTGDGVGMVTMNLEGTDDGTFSIGTIIFECGKMKTQAEAGAYVSGITTPPTGMTDVGGKTEIGTDGTSTAVKVVM